MSSIRDEVVDDDHPRRIPATGDDLLPARTATQPQNPAATRRSQEYGYHYGGGQTQREKPLSEYVSTVLYYKYVIALCLLIGVFVGKEIHRRQPILFQTSAMVNVGRYVPPTEGPTAQIIQFETSRSEYMQNLIPILTSYSVAKWVIAKNPAIREVFDPIGAAKHAVKDGDQDPQNVSGEELGADIPIDALNAYLGAISTFHDANTTLLSITSTSVDPILAARIANAHAEAFMEQVRRQRFVWAMTNVEFLSKRAEELRERLKVQETALQEFARENHIVANGQAHQTLHITNRIEGLTSAISEASLETVIQDHGYRALRQSLSSDGISAVSDKSVTMLPLLRQLESEVDRMRRNGRGRFATEPIERQAQDIRNILRQSTNQELKQARARRLSSEAKENFLRRELATVKQSLDHHSVKESEYMLQEREVKTIRDELAKLDSRLEEARINAESDQKTVQLVDAAVVPTAPLGTRRVSTMLSGALLGFLVGVVLAFLFDHQRGAIRSVSDIQSIIDAPVLGIVPSFSRDFRRLLRTQEPSFDATPSSSSPDPLLFPRDEFSRTFAALFSGIDDAIAVTQAFRERPISRLLLTVKPYGSESESIRNIRAALKFGSRGRAPRTILVTSGQKGDGKTTLAANLAASMAQTSARTLLIDADLRMPTAHQYFHYRRDQLGLGDYLMAPGRLEDFTLTTDIEYLSIMVAGQIVDNPAELLGSSRMVDLIEQAQEEYDYVFIDTPPIGEIADALLICPKCDGVVVVTRSNATPTAVLKLASARLDLVRARILGTVLNGMGTLEGQSYGYPGSGYAYGSEQRRP